MRGIATFLVIGLLFTSEICSAQAQIQVKHARVELLSSPVARNQIQLGVHFMLDKGWHIYWVNPGDSGQPPSFHWILPPGATAGEIQWPRPERLQSSPSIADYGYEGDVLLMVPVHLASSGDMSSERKIAVDAKWLICREVCLPDHAQLSLALPESSSGSQGSAELFARSKAMLPRVWPKDWKAKVESLENDFILTIITGRPLAHAEFFPLDPGQIENAAKQKITPTKIGANLLLRKSDLLLKSIAELRGLLVVGSRAYQLRAPVIAHSR